MGQRLIINITNGDDILASAYYHWSAYTLEAASLTRNIIKNMIQTQQNADNILFYEDNKNEKRDKLMAYLLLETTGAGIYIGNGVNDKEINELKKLTNRLNYRIGENRNEGLIALTPESIKYLNDWAEGTVNIDISNDTVEFKVFGECLKNEINEETDKIKEIDFDDIEYFSFDNVHEWYEKIGRMCDDEEYPYYKDKANDVYYQVIA